MRVRLAMVCVLAVVAATGAACTTEKPPAGGVSVTAAGGTYPLGAMTVIAEPGTVTSDTRLSVTTTPGTEAPAGLLGGLGALAVAFDLTLGDGAQPAKPLKVDIPLTGAFLPPGARPADALLYSRTADGKGFVIMAGDVDSSGVLHAELDHLSDKAVVYLDDKQWQQLIDSGAIEVLPQISCAGTLDVGATHLKISTADKTKRLRGCLETVAGKTYATIENGTDYMWSVASSQGDQTIQPTIDGYDDEAVKLISATFYSVWGREFVAGKSFVRVQPDLKRLPITVTLRADQVVASSEAIWSGFKLFVGYVAGIANGEEVFHLAKILINDVSTVDACLGDVIRHEASAARLTVKVITDCGLPIAEAILTHLGEAAARTKAEKIHKALLRRLGVSASALSAALGNLATRIDGTVQLIRGNQIVFTVTVTNCVSASKVNGLLGGLVRDLGVPDPKPVIALRGSGKVSCQDGWALLDDVGHYNSAEDRAIEYPALFGSILIHWTGDRWTGVYGQLNPFDCGTGSCGRTRWGDTSECRQAPKAYRSAVGC